MANHPLNSDRPRAPRARTAWTLLRLRPLLLAPLLLAPLAHGADGEDYQSQIEKVEESIEVTRDAIRLKTSERDSLQRLLASTNKQIAAIKRQRAQLKATIAKLQQTKRGEARRGEALRSRVDAEGVQLGDQLRAMYRAGRNPQLRTLLSLDDPAAGGRMLRYYQHVTAHRLDAIARARGSLDNVMREVTRVGEQASQVQRERDALAAREAELTKLSKRRQSLLGKISATLSQDQSRLSTLEGDRAHLQQLLDELGARQQAAAAPRGRGELPWPLVGKLTARYGQPKPQGTAKWAGILIKALKGSPVVAVHEGQVVYAEWLRGFGLLIIVDHGNGVMSLYGNNDELLFNVGETVLPGDVIATVGDSSSLNETGLYFELRQDGSPVDPVELLSEEVAAATR